MCEYLGKKKLYELLNNVVKPEMVQLMKNCEYKKYRGSEWLTMCVDFDFVIKIYRSGLHLAIDFYEINDSDLMDSIDRMCFSLGNNFLHVNYWRNGENRFVKEGVNLFQIPLAGGM